MASQHPHGDRVTNARGGQTPHTHPRAKILVCMSKDIRFIDAMGGFDAVSLADCLALGLWFIIAVLSWISWSLLQNQKFIFDRPRGIALAIGITTTLATWCEFVLMREHNPK